MVRSVEIHEKRRNGTGSDLIFCELETKSMHGSVKLIWVNVSGTIRVGSFQLAIG